MYQCWQGLRNEELRDEIYCLVVKQTNRNPYKELCARVWELLTMCVATFLPSRTFVKFLNCCIFRFFVFYIISLNNVRK